MALDIIPQVLKTGCQEDKGDIARIQYFVGAIAVGDLVKSTLGPKGSDKILQPVGGEGSRIDKTTITNDGATILKSLWLDNPAAKILVDISKQQDTKCGDGTTGVVVLAAELLRNAERLIEQKIHPQIICSGYQASFEKIKETLKNYAFSCSEELFEQNLRKVAQTTLSSKLLKNESQFFAELAVNAVLRLKGTRNLDYIKIIKKPGGTLRDSYLEPGFILDKPLGAGYPKILKNCKVLVANTPMDTDKIKIYGARVKVDSFQAVQELEDAEKEKMKHKVESIASHGCNVFINRQLIYNYPDQIFKDKNILAIEHADFDGTERLAAVLGATIASVFDTPTPIELGECEQIEEILIGEEKAIRFSGCKQNEACTIILRGANQHILDEAERSLHDAIAIVSETIKDKLFVYGAGSIEMSMAEIVHQLACEEKGKKSLACKAFSHALRQIPTIIASNAGLDEVDLISRLRAEHRDGDKTAGISINTGTICNGHDLGVLESYKSKLSQVSLAVEAAIMIIRVDNIIRCAPRQREGM